MGNGQAAGAPPLAPVAVVTLPNIQHTHTHVACSLLALCNLTFARRSVDPADDLSNIVPFNPDEQVYGLWDVHASYAGGLS